MAMLRIDISPVIYPTRAVAAYPALSLGRCRTGWDFGVGDGRPLVAALLAVDKGRVVAPAFQQIREACLVLGLDVRLFRLDEPLVDEIDQRVVQRRHAEF